IGRRRRTIPWPADASTGSLDGIATLLPVAKAAVDEHRPVTGPIEKAGRDRGPLSRAAVRIDRTVCGYLGQASREVGDVHVHRPGDVPAFPLPVLPDVEHGDCAAIEHSSQTAHVANLVARKRIAGAAPGVDAALEGALDLLDSNAGTLAGGLERILPLIEHE